MQVELPKEYQEQLFNSMKDLLLKAVEETERKTAINSPWLKGRRAACKWLSISDSTLKKLIDAGCPVHFVDGLDGVYFFKKSEITEFLLKQ